MAMEMAKSFTPSIRVLNALAFKTFEKLFTTLEALSRIFGIFFADLSTTSPTPDNTFPIPSAGLSALSAIS